MFEHVPRKSLRSLKAQPRPLMRYSSLALAVAGCCCSLAAAAQVSSPSATVELPRVEIVSTGPSNSSGQTKDKVAANVQTATAADLERLHALDLSNYLARALGSVNINEMQGNPFQADVNFRGFTASPLLGTPQGLSVYMDGVRLNQPFGDVVSWDLIPRAAIATVTLMPGSNPLFGLNTLGGALSVQTKDGLKNPGTSVQVLGGANQRAAVEFETGGSNADGLHWFVTGNRFHEKGWRAASPSDVSQLFGKFGRHDGGLDLSLTAAIADNDLTGNGLQEQSALQRDRRSVYTTPDITRNRSLFLNLEASQILSNGIKLAGNAYYRRINTATLNGDANDGALDQSVYQPSSAEQAALLAAGFTGYPSSGANAGNTPFPKWRCIANVLTNQEPNEKCNGLINTTQTLQHNAGLALQASGAGVLAGLTHQWLLGAAYDASRVHFNQGSQFGYINPDRSITAVNGPGAFADGTQNSENAFDARVDLSSRTHTSSVFASSSLALNPQTQLTLSGRFNRNVVQNRDAITPGGGTGSLDGDYVFSHFNPGVGLTFAASKALTLYASANQGARAPTAIELGCADPASPCKLPNSFAGDPPLRQVVTTSVEAGLRGKAGSNIDWNMGLFRADNRDDLLFVSDNSSGYGYFRNFGQTRRQGLELGLKLRATPDLTLGANASWLDATYRSAERVGGSSNSSNDAALGGAPGTQGSIQIQPGDRIPLLPRSQLKVFADWQINPQWSVGLDMIASAGALARGNENAQHQADGLYYTGPGRSAGYALLNFNADYRPTRSLKLFLQINNLLDRQYNTAAQLGANAFGANGNYQARPLPANANGDYPLIHSTFYAPGAPRTAWVGVRMSFGD